MALKILQQARHHRVDLPILVRTMNVSDSKRLRDARATEILPEALETSVFMGAQLLSLMGVPRSRIQEHKETVRESEYQLLHQIFADATTSSTKEHPEEALQTVRLPEKADAVGHTPASLGLLDRGVMLLAIIPILQIMAPQHSVSTVSWVRESRAVFLRIGIRRDGKKMQSPSGDTRIRAGDVLILSGHTDDLARAKKYLLNGSNGPKLKPD